METPTVYTVLADLLILAYLEANREGDEALYQILCDASSSLSFRLFERQNP